MEKCGRVYGVSGEGCGKCMGRGSMLACGERMWGEEWGRCREMW